MSFVRWTSYLKMNGGHFSIDSRLAWHDGWNQQWTGTASKRLPGRLVTKPKPHWRLNVRIAGHPENVFWKSRRTVDTGFLIVGVGIIQDRGYRHNKPLIKSSWRHVVKEQRFQQITNIQYWWTRKKSEIRFLFFVTHLNYKPWNIIFVLFVSFCGHINIEY